MAHTQDRRIGKLKVSGGIELSLVRFTANEAISEPFIIHVDAWSEDKDNIDFDPAIGKPASVSIDTADGEKRWFSGFLAETARTADASKGFLYHLVIRPQLHFLTKQIASRVYEKQTVNQILTKVFNEHGLAFVDKTTRTYPTLEYCVQYRESDFDFASRMMEAHGISYHHKFDDNTHELQLCDVDRVPMPGKAGPVRKFRLNDNSVREDESLFEWSKMRAHTTGKVMIKDYDMLKPTTDYESEVQTDAKYAHPQLEDYVPLYHQHLQDKITEGFGKDYATYRLQSYRSQDNNFSAAGDSPGLTPGFLMKLQDHPNDDAEYVVVRANHSLSMQGYRSGQTPAAQYTGSYLLYPNGGGKPWTPPIRTPRPRISGIETGVVVGDSEIDVDKYGRILVQFHWNKKEAKYQTLRTRVAQMWAGNLWGSIYIPRKGMEVVVTFVEGDPDRPLVIGSVYNADNMPPYPLTGEKNVSGIKSRSTEKAKGYNEIAFDDTAGKELFRKHAQFDYETKILHDERRDIENDRTTNIKNNDTLTVDQNILIEAKKSLTLKVGKSTIVMDQKSISIDSPEVKVVALMNLETHSNITAKHSSAAPMIINGAIVKIN
jgi:type VI secretion system secreted protein VgrG